MTGQIGFLVVTATSRCSSNHPKGLLAEAGFGGGWALLLWLVLISVSTGARADLTTEVVDNWGGPVNGAAIVGTIAFIGSGQTLRAIDLSDEANPVQIGSINIGEPIKDVRVRGSYAYVGARQQRFLNIVNISDPTNLVLVRSMSNTIVDGGWNIQFHAQRAYVQSSLDGGKIYIYDILDPPNASLVGEVPLVGDATSILVRGDYLYVGRSSNPLRVYRLFAAASPVQVANLASTWQVRALAAQGDYLHMIGFESRFPSADSFLATLDISNPSNPIVTSTVSGSEIGFKLTKEVKLAIATSDKRLYVGTKSMRLDEEMPGGLLIYDIESEPSIPELLYADRPSHGDTFAVLAATNNRIYLSDTAEGFVIVDANESLPPRRLGKYHSPAYVKDVVKDGTHLFISDFKGGFSILDVADPSEPQLVGHYLARADSFHFSEITGIAVEPERSRVYVTAGRSGLLIVDISTLSKPTTAGALRISDIPTSLIPPSDEFRETPRFGGLVVRDGTVYVHYLLVYGQYTDGYLLSIDAIEPTNPAVLNALLLANPFCAYLPGSDMLDLSAVISGDLLFSGKCGYTFDISDPTALKVVFWSQTVPSISYASDARVDGNITFRVTAQHGSPIPDLSPGLHVQNVSLPSHPLTLVIVDEDDWPCNDSMGTMVYLSKIALTNGRAYLGSWTDNLIVFDVTDPSSPTCLHRRIGVGGSSGLLVEEPYIFATKQHAGLQILEIGGIPSQEAVLFQADFESLNK